MLAQMAQVMAIRQAQQGYESENAVKDFYAQGGDLSTAEGRRNLMAKTGSSGAKLIGAQSEINARDVKTGMDSLKMLKDNVAVVNTPSDMAIYLQNAAKTPGGQMLFGVVPLDKALANIPTDPKLFDAYKRNFGLTADRLYESADAQLSSKTSLATNAASVGATIRGQNLTDARAREGSLTPHIFGDKVYLTNNRTGEITEAMMPEPTNGKVTVGPITTIPEPTGGGAAPINALAPQPAAGAAPVANALVQPPATPAPARQPLTTFNPKKVARETTNAAGDVTQYNERGEVVAVVPKAGKPSAAFEKDLVTEAKKTEGQKTVQTLVSSLADQYKGLLQEGGITSTANSALSNIGARSGSSTVGQFAAGFVGTKAQELRDSIAQTRPLIINAIKDSTGMSAQQLNSNVELQNFLKAATDPTLSIEANLKALNNLSKLYGLGKELTMADMKGNPASTGNIATDPTIDALLKKYK
jgi:hypothetical protein